MTGRDTEHVVVTPRGAQRLLARHPWVYRSDVRRRPDRPGPYPVGDRRGQVLAWALVNAASEITVRAFHFGDLEDPAATLLASLDRALERRAGLGGDPEGALRLVHAEGDLLPGLVVDRYADWLVVQCGSAALEPLIPRLVDRLVERLAPCGVLARNDQRSRTLEGLPQVVEVLRGEVPETIRIREGDVTLILDPRRGQKTGGYLDQRENRAVLRRALGGRPRDGRALDVFAYEGAFALQIARVFDRVEAVDSSAEALDRARRNAETNGITGLSLVEGNAFDVLRQRSDAKARYDCIVLDPPAFAKRRADLERAYAAYKEINLRAMKLLVPGGILATASCSHHMDEPIFYDALRDAAGDAHRTVRILEQRGQAPDHPVLLNAPETRYLKFALLEVL